MKITDKLLAILMPNKSVNHKIVKFKTHAVINYTDFLRDGSPYNISTNYGDWNVELLKYKIVGTISKYKEFDFDCENYVEKVMNEQHYQNYNYKSVIERWVKTKEESFISLIQSKGIPVDKLNMKLLILEKHG